MARRSADEKRQVKEIIAANLRYGASAEPLLHRAYAHVVSKVLFLAGRGVDLSVSDILKGCKELTLRGRPTNKHVNAALNLLQTHGVAEHRGGRSGRERYVLDESSWDDIEAQLAARRDRLGVIVREHFPNEISLVQLLAWFDDVAARFMAAYGDVWVREITGRMPHQSFTKQRLKGLVGVTAKPHGLQDHVEQLECGFRQFLTSEDPADQAMIWHYGRALFAARLMAADLSSDPISAGRLRGSLLLLDTNVMIDLALLEAVDDPAIEALKAALDHHDIDIRHLPVTFVEYRHVQENRKNRTRNLAKTFSFMVLRISDDDWIRAGVHRGFSSGLEMEALFDELMASPPSTPVHDEETLDASGLGEADDELVAQVQRAWRNRWPDGRPPKSLPRARHDAALEAAAAHVRGTGRICHVVSSDQSMRAFSKEKAGPTGIATWISLESLLQVFATEQGSGTEDASDFAPLLSQLIKEDLHHLDRLSISIDDLDYLAELDAQVNDLPVEEVQVLARKLHKLRLEGADRSDPELRRIIGNSIRKTRRRLGYDLETARSKVASEEDRARMLEGEVQTTFQILVEERAKAIRGLAKRGLVASTLGGLAGLVALLVIAYRIWIWIFDSPEPPNREATFSVAAGLFGLLVILPPLIFKSVKHFLKRIRNSEELAEDQLRREGKAPTTIE